MKTYQFSAIGNSSSNGTEIASKIEENKCLQFLSNKLNQGLIKMLNMGPSFCLKIEEKEIKPLFLKSIRLSGTHELKLIFSDNLMPLPMEFVKDFLDDKVLDLRSRSAIDYEEVMQGSNIYKNSSTDEQ